MISQGWSNIGVWHMDDLCYVPSQTSPGEKGYFVDILRLTCECQSRHPKEAVDANISFSFRIKSTLFFLFLFFFCFVLFFFFMKQMP